jgi:hypothetical protein
MKFAIAGAASDVAMTSSARTSINSISVKARRHCHLF